MTGPLELTGIQRDDELLDRLGQGQGQGGLGDVGDVGDVAVIMRAWRADILRDIGGDEAPVLAAPAPAPPAAPLRGRIAGGHPRFRPVACAAALAIVFGSVGVGAAAGQASPDSVLFPLTKVVAGQHADSVLAREEVRTALELAQRQAASGDMGAARKTLHSAQQRVADVRPVDGRDVLRAEVRQAQTALGTVPAPSPAPTVDPTAAPSPTGAPGAPTPTPDPSPPPEETPEPSPPPEETPEPTPSPPAPAPAEVPAEAPAELPEVGPS